MFKRVKLYQSDGYHQSLAQQLCLHNHKDNDLTYHH